MGIEPRSWSPGLGEFEGRDRPERREPPPGNTPQDPLLREIKNTADLRFYRRPHVSSGR
jgi:hypothetical protein